MALLNYYESQFNQWRTTIDGFGAWEKLKAYFTLFYIFNTKFSGMCPLCAFASDQAALPSSLKVALEKNSKIQGDWMLKIIEQGQQQKEFRMDLPAQEVAELILALGLGVQLIARTLNDSDHIHRIIKQLKILLKPISTR